MRSPFKTKNAMLYVNSMVFLTFNALYFAIGNEDCQYWSGSYFLSQYIIALTLIEIVKKYQPSPILNMLKSLFFALSLYVILTFYFGIIHGEVIIFLYFIFSLFLLSHENLIKKIWGQ